MSLHVQTPVIESVPLSLLTKREVFLKLECVQPSGSFKLRGLGLVCETLKKQGVDTVICPSSGNAGYSMAWAARKLHMRAIVVAPENTPKEAIDAIALLGAEVRVEGAVWDISNERAQALEKELPNAKYLSSYDDPLLWHGYSSMVVELERQMQKPDVILLSIGGGGMMSGVLEGLDRVGWSDVPVIGCGTYGANAFSESIRAGRLVRLPEVDTLVNCISACEITPRVMELAKTHTLIPYLCSDLSAVRACQRFLDDHRLLVDASCGVTLSALYGNTPLLKEAGRVLAVVCGGVGVKGATLARLERLALEREKREQ